MIPSEKVDRDEIAVRTVASGVLHTMVMASIDRDNWEDQLDDLSEADCVLVLAEVQRLAKLMNVSDFAYRTSYQFLVERA